MVKNFGIAFVTGRVQFQSVLKTYFDNWIEHDLINSKHIKLHLFVVYDVTYSDAEREDFRDIPPEIKAMLESVNFYGRTEIEDECRELVSGGVLTESEAELLFRAGYAGNRNAALHFARRKKMDRLLFLDDDEYPVAVTKDDRDRLSWMGQSVVGSHLRFGANADITNGRHCGYISPIPHVSFDRRLTEDDFRLFIEAISNDIISWDRVKNTTIENRGVTFAARDIIENNWVEPVQEINGMKFISGANLCFNLERMKHPPVFYNPPGARGEDAFMSTTLRNHKVMRIPCYTFHDAFSEYQHLLKGVLPQQLKGVDSRSPGIVNRFAKAAVGWARYKPLLTYITNRPNYEAVMTDAISKLEQITPRLCEHFGTSKFETVTDEFREYHKNVQAHFDSFDTAKQAWEKMIHSRTSGLPASIGG